MHSVRFDALRYSSDNAKLYCLCRECRRRKDEEGASDVYSHRLYQWQLQRQPTKYDLRRDLAARV